MDLFSEVSYPKPAFRVKLTTTSAASTEYVLDILSRPCRYEDLMFVLISQLSRASPMWRPIDPDFAKHVPVSKVTVSLQVKGERENLLVSMPEMTYELSSMSMRWSDRTDKQALQHTKVLGLLGAFRQSIVGKMRPRSQHS